MAKNQEQSVPWLWLHSPDAADGGVVGGPAALSRALLWSEKNNLLPQTAVITTAAYRAAGVDGLARLTRDVTRDLAPHDTAAIRQASVRLTRAWQRAILPKPVVRAVTQVWQKLGKSAGSVVLRPSPVQWADTASTVAEQYVTIERIKNEAALAAALRRVWASGFSEAALAWRLQHGLDPAGFDLAVAVQADGSRGGWLYPIDPVLHSNAVWCAETETAQARIFVPERVDAAVIESIDGLADTAVVALVQSLRPVAANKAVRILWHQDGKNLVPAWVTNWAQPRASESVTMRYELKKTGPIVATGTGYGAGIAAGAVAIVDEDKACPAGAIAVVAELTPRVMASLAAAAGVICEETIVSGYAAALMREYNIPAVAGVPRARTLCKKAGTVTIANQADGSGLIYQGVLPFEVFTDTAVPNRRIKTDLLAVVTQSEHMADIAALPVTGAEFSLAFAWSAIGVHPLTVLRGPHHTARAASAVGDLASSVARVAAAFFPRPVHVRLSSFGSTEFSVLEGGKEYQDQEAEGQDVQGAGRYLTSEYGPVFALECQVLQRVRAFGLTNVQPIFPFCRTPEEAKAVRSLAETNGLTTKAGWKLAVACSIPANVVLAREMVRIFDALYIDAHGLTDDRTNRQWLRHIISAARRARKPVHAAGRSLGQNPTLVQFLLQQKITSITVLPEAVVATQREIGFVEQTVGRTGNRTSVRALAMVITAGLLAAGLLGLGAGCSREPAELPTEGGSDVSPADLRVRMENKFNDQLQKQQAEFLEATTTLRVSTFATFTVVYPRAWQVEYRTDRIVFINTANENVTITRQKKTRGLADSREFPLADGSLLEVAGNLTMVEKIQTGFTFE